jgi:hypothetical protein
MDGIFKELELIRHQKEASQNQLQAMEKARRVKKGAPGIGDGVDEGGVAKGIGIREGVCTRRRKKNSINSPRRIVQVL